MTAPVPTNADGSVNFPALGSGKPTTGGATSIWDVPSDLTDYLNQISGGKLWFNIGHKAVTKFNKVAPETPEPGITQPGLMGANGGSSPTGAGSANAAEHDAGTRYKEKREAYDIMSKPEQVMAQIAAMSYNDPNGFLAIQKALASGPWGAVHLTGSFDHDTEKALGNAMLQYVKLSMGAGVSVPFTQYLLQGAQLNQQLGGGAAQRQPFQASLTDPTSIKAAAQSAAQAALGQGLSEDQLSKFVAQFQAAQTSAEQTNYNGTGTVTAPDLSAQAMQFAQQANPQEYQQNQRQAFLNTLVNMFAPSGSNRPGMTPVPSVGG